MVIAEAIFDNFKNDLAAWAETGIGFLSVQFLLLGMVIVAIRYPSELGVSLRKVFRE